MPVETINSNKVSPKASNNNNKKKKTVVDEQQKTLLKPTSKEVSLKSKKSKDSSISIPTPKNNHDDNKIKNTKSKSTLESSSTSSSLAPSTTVNGDHTHGNPTINKIDPSSLKVLNKSGGNLGKKKPIFSKDDRFLFVPVRSQIYVISVNTGEVVTIMSNDSFTSISQKSITTTSSSSNVHIADISQLIPHPSNPLQILSVSLDGTIRSWDSETFSFLKCWHIGAPIISILPCHQSKTGCLVVTKIRKQCDVYQFDLKTSKKTLVFSTTKDAINFQISLDDRFILWSGKKSVYVFDLLTSTTKSHDLHRQITCTAVHPNDYFFVFGEDDGRIHMVNFEEWAINDKYAYTIMHWHAHTCNTLDYSPDGNYLISGGPEAVLVIWQLNSNHKSFLPRLGSEISNLCISSSQSYYATIHADSSIRLISGTSNSVKEIVIGTKETPQPKSAYPFYRSMVVEPKHGHVVMDAAAGDLQFYDGVQGRHVRNFEVTGKMRISKGDQQDIFYTNVRDVAFSPDGQWMATAEGRHMTVGDLGREVVLKFWNFDKVSQKYILNTRVDDVHKEDLTALEFQHIGKELICVTSSSDGKFKLWALDQSFKEEKDVFWTCRSVGYYKDHPALCASFSFDGSILAVGFGTNITLWNPLTNTIEAVLTAPANIDVVLKVDLIKDTSYLVATYSKKIVVWNLLNLQVAWSYSIHTKFTVQADVATSLFGVILHDSKRLYLFEPSSTEPLYKLHLNDKCITFDFCKGDHLSTKDTPKLMAMTENRQILFISVEPKVADENTTSNMENEDKKKVLKAQYKQQSVFDSLFGGHTISASKYSEVNTQQVKLTDSIISILDYPSHMLPEPSLLALGYFEQVLNKTEEEEEVPAVGVAERNGELDEDDQKIVTETNILPESTELIVGGDVQQENLPEFNTQFIENIFDSMKL